MEASELSDRLLIGIPKKGRLAEQVLTLLQGADIQFMRKNRLDIALSTNHPLALVFLPAADIAIFVGEGNVDIGITGQDMVAEGEANVEELLKLGFGACRLCLQVPVKSGFTTARDLVGKRVVTSFESLARKHFDKVEAEMRAEGLNPPRTVISYVSGSVEAACALGLADAIVDLVESGETMHAAKLHDIETLISSQAVLISNPKKHQSNPLIEKIRRRIEGVIVAQRYVLCTYNVPRGALTEVVKVTPGKKAPTISPLEHGDWVAVSVMVTKKTVVDTVDKLEEMGAQDILITDIKNARMGHNGDYF
ncbi:ATP phosphoribosyltransferase (ATP-PRTase) (ATP-PRT) [Irineochytrium annulatum]|nr:ATP phosphoribosyltransferase (ATP-PRTase) (ATP-PRT) [Irineochytrium annulatum]